VNDAALYVAVATNQFASVPFRLQRAKCTEIVHHTCKYFNRILFQMKGAWNGVELSYFQDAFLAFLLIFIYCTYQNLVISTVTAVRTSDPICVIFTTSNTNIWNLNLVR
jgi:hypothetical protein